MQKLTREQTLDVAIQKIVANPQAEFLIIIDNKDAGIELLHSTTSFIWMLGVLSSSEKLVDEDYRQRIRSAVSQAGQEAKQREVIAMTENQGVKN